LTGCLINYLLICRTSAATTRTTTGRWTARCQFHLFLKGGGIRRLTVLLRIQTFLENYKRHLNFQIWLQQDFNPNQP